MATKNVSELKKGDLVKTGTVWREVQSISPNDANGTEYAMELEGATPCNFPASMSFEVRGLAAADSRVDDLFGGVLDPYRQQPMRGPYPGGVGYPYGG